MVVDAVVVVGVVVGGRGGPVIGVVRGGVAVVVVESVVVGRDSAIVGLLLGADLVVSSVEGFGLRAVKVEPPIADEIVLIENCSVWAKE